MPISTETMDKIMSVVGDRGFSCLVMRHEWWCKALETNALSDCECDVVIELPRYDA